MFPTCMFLLLSNLWAAEQSLTTEPFVEILGVAQDAGHPQAGCERICCEAAWDDPKKGHLVASLAIVDPTSGERWLIDATPDLAAQLRHLNQTVPTDSGDITGIFLTHAHIGHYTGLMHLGREVMGAKDIPVYAMPRMVTFLESSGPWELLVRLENIRISPLRDSEEIILNSRIRIRPIQVPHRSEYTETVGFVVTGPNRSVLYLPDIDKWERWDTPVEKVIATVDRAYLDGTFFADGEIEGRSMADIPHPFVVESMTRFSALTAEERNKIYFLHFNHTNPLLRPGSPEGQTLREAGMHRAQQGDRLAL